MNETKTAGESLETLEEKLGRLSAGFPVSSAEKAEIDERNQEERGRVKVQKIGALRYSWNAPPRHVGFHPGNEGEWGKRLEQAKYKLCGNGVILALVGTRGNGKTQLAVELMKWRTESLRSALFATAVEFFMDIKATYKADCRTSEADVLRLYGKPSLLVIDEVGKRGQSDWENNLLFQLLNSRYNNMKDSVLIDNNGKEAFIEAIGPSLASRMNEGGGIIECTWPSFRQ